MTHFRQKVKCFTRSSGNFFIRKVNRKKTKNAKAASVIVRTSRMCFNCAPIPSHKKTVLADGFLMAGVTGLVLLRKSHLLHKFDNFVAVNCFVCFLAAFCRLKKPTKLRLLR